MRINPRPTPPPVREKANGARISPGPDSQLMGQRPQTVLVVLLTIYAPGHYASLSVQFDVARGPPRYSGRTADPGRDHCHGGGRRAAIASFKRIPAPTTRAGNESAAHRMATTQACDPFITRGKRFLQTPLDRPERRERARVLKRPDLRGPFPDDRRAGAPPVRASRNSSGLRTVPLRGIPTLARTPRGAAERKEHALSLHR